MSRAATKSAALRRLIRSPVTEFLIEAHSGISARIGEEAGFAGIWASGLGHLGAVRRARQQRAVLDAGARDPRVHGRRHDDPDPARRRHRLRRLQQHAPARAQGGARAAARASASRTSSSPRPTASSTASASRSRTRDEFCGKIKAGKDSQRDPDFCVVARVEALIAGWGVDEALRRAEAYHAAGADAILIHSKRRGRRRGARRSRARWERRLPLIIVPTTYYSTPTEVFRRAGISVVIWANHLIRASVAAMQRAARLIHDAESLVDVEGQIAPVGEIFRLQGADELLAAEKLYTKRGSGAARRRDPGGLARRRARGAHRGAPEGDARGRGQAAAAAPGRPLQGRRRSTRSTSSPATRPKSIDVQGIRLLHNPDYASSGELTSLACARERLRRRHDRAVRRPAVPRLHAARPPERRRRRVTVVVDSAPLPEHGNQNDLAWCSAPDDRALYRQDVALAARLARATLAGARARRAAGSACCAPAATGVELGEGRARDAAARGRTSRAWACRIC